MWVLESVASASLNGLGSEVYSLHSFAAFRHSSIPYFKSNMHHLKSALRSAAWVLLFLITQVKIREIYGKILIREDGGKEG